MVGEVWFDIVGGIVGQVQVDGFGWCDGVVVGEVCVGFS